MFLGAQWVAPVKVWQLLKPNFVWLQMAVEEVFPARGSEVV